MRKNLWDGWELNEKIGEGRFAEVYKATKRIDGVNLTCAVKYVSLPKSQEELNELVKNGVINNVQEANEYYLKIIDDLKNEIDLMKRFKGNNNIIDFFDYIHENKYDGTGVDFYIRMELAEDLDNYFNSRKVKEQDVIKLGIDICNALEVCASLKIVHKDIKPSNIYIGTDGNYKLGDFGIASSFESDNNHFIGTYNYMAPEIYNKGHVNYSTDLYSLGIVMYKLLNNNRLPFATKFSSDKDILKTRMSGIQLFPIKGVDKKLMDIIIKACSYDAKDRYKDAISMKKDLEKILDNVVEKTNVSSNEKTVSIYDVEADRDIVLNNSNSVNNKYINIIKFDFRGLFDKIKFNLKNNKIIKIVIGIIFILLLLFLVRSCTSAKKCDSGFVNKNGFCVKGYYYCDEGYYLNGDNKCQKTVESFAAKLRLQCDKDYVLNGENCIKNDTKEPKSSYQCAPGFTLKGNKCIGEKTIAPNVSYNCSSGYTLVGDSCAKVTTQEASVSYSCPNSRYNRNGTICSYTENNSSYIKTTESCPSGYEKSSYNGKCCKMNYWVPSCVDPTVTKSCSKGTYNGSTCVITNTIEATVNYSCPSGYEQMLNQCVKTDQKKASMNVSCSSGYTLKNNMCYTSVTVDAVSGYTCDNGYIFTGQACVSNDKRDAIKKYSCSRAYTLNGDKCEKYIIKSAKAHYSE